MSRRMTKVIAEQATGCREHPKGLGGFYDNNGKELSNEAAADLIIDGKSVAVPNAGAGSYADFAKRLGYRQAKIIDDTSSAGDWTFAAFDGLLWHVFYQNNRYPHHGYEYLKNTEFTFDVFEDAAEFCD
jgi:hypothetical protein